MGSAARVCGVRRCAGPGEPAQRAPTATARLRLAARVGPGPNAPASRFEPSALAAASFLFAGIRRSAILPRPCPAGSGSPPTIPRQRCWHAGPRRDQDRHRRRKRQGWQPRPRHGPSAVAGACRAPDIRGLAATAPAGEGFPAGACPCAAAHRTGAAHVPSAGWLLPPLASPEGGSGGVRALSVQRLRACFFPALAGSSPNKKQALRRPPLALRPSRCTAARRPRSTAIEGASGGSRTLEKET